MVEELVKRGTSNASVVVRVLTGSGMALFGLLLLFYLVVDNEIVVNPYPIVIPALALPCANSHYYLLPTTTIR